VAGPLREGTRWLSTRGRSVTVGRPVEIEGRSPPPGPRGHARRGVHRRPPRVRARRAPPGRARTAAGVRLVGARAPREGLMKRTPPNGGVDCCPDRPTSNDSVVCPSDHGGPADAGAAGTGADVRIFGAKSARGRTSAEGAPDAPRPGVARRRSRGCDVAATTLTGVTASSGRTGALVPPDTTANTTTTTCSPCEVRGQRAWACEE
jgi:hypothetical protein